MNMRLRSFYRLSLLVLASLVSVSARAAESSLFTLENQPVPPPPALVTPTGVPAFAPQLVSSASGPVLAWFEASDTGLLWRSAVYQPATRAWAVRKPFSLPKNEAVPVVAGYSASLFTSDPDGRIAFFSTRTVAGKTTLFVRSSADAGVTWSYGISLTTSSDPVIPAAAVFLSNERLLTAWISSVNNQPALQTRIIPFVGPPPPAPKPATPGAPVPPAPAQPPTVTVDPRVSADSAPALVAYADGSALLTWRGHTDENVRDIQRARLRNDVWQAPATLSPDDWRTPASPGEGVVLDARGPHVAAAWFSAAEGDRVQVSVSANAGSTWLMPNRVDDIAPIGRPSVVLLDDGSQLVSWVERIRPDGGDFLILIRRVSPRGTLSPPVELARLATDPGHPRLARVKDGDANPAQLLLAYTTTSPSSASSAADLSTLNPQLSTSLLTLPDAALLAEVDACDCDPRKEDQRGYPLKARVVSLDPNTGSLSLEHNEIPGLLPAATAPFRAAPEILKTLKPGQTVLARIERIGPDWWLFSPRVLLVTDRAP